MENETNLKTNYLPWLIQLVGLICAFLLSGPNKLLNMNILMICMLIGFISSISFCFMSKKIKNAKNHAIAGFILLIVIIFIIPALVTPKGEVSHTIENKQEK